MFLASLACLPCLNTQFTVYIESQVLFLKHKSDYPSALFKSSLCLNSGNLILLLFLHLIFLSPDFVYYSSALNVLPPWASLCLEYSAKTVPLPILFLSLPTPFVLSPKGYEISVLRLYNLMYYNFILGIFFRHKICSITMFTFHGYVFLNAQPNTLGYSLFLRKHISF